MLFWPQICILRSVVQVEIKIYNIQDIFHKSNYLEIDIFVYIKQHLFSSILIFIKKIVSVERGFEYEGINIWQIKNLQTPLKVKRDFSNDNEMRCFLSFLFMTSSIDSSVCRLKVIQNTNYCFLCALSNNKIR